MKHVKITATLLSPLAGEAPMLDAILERHAFQNNIDGCAALSAGRQLNSHDRLTYDMLDCVPLGRHSFDDGSVCYCVSSPIVDCAYETTEHFVRRADFKSLSGKIKPKEMAKLRQNIGPYAPSFEPHKCRTVKAIVWYAYAAPIIESWLKNIKFIGGKTAAGYGKVGEWRVEDSEDYWMTAEGVLMRPVPACAFPDGINGGVPYFGAIKPPYWHPMRQMDIIKPC